MLDTLNANLTTFYFATFAFVAVACALGVLLARHPLHGAINLIGVMLSLAGLYAIIGSPYLAVLQVLVYAGAIMMLVVFVIMVLGQARDDHTPRFDLLSAAGLLLPIAVAAVSVMALAGARPALATAGAAEGGVANIAPVMFNTAAGGPGYYLLFLLIGVLLLVAVVAAVLLAKRSLDTPQADVNPEEASHGH